MSFLTMFWWIGPSAMSIPLIIHILNRRRYQRMRWAAMDFLLMAEKITRRRIRIEHILLLIIRMLAVLLLCWALARPVLTGAAASNLLVKGDRNVVVLLDDSYSMTLTNSRGETAFDRAHTRLNELVKNLRSGDRLTLLRTSDAYRWSSRRTTGPNETSETGDAEKAENRLAPYVYLSYVELKPMNRDEVREKIDQLQPSDVHTDFYETFKLMDKESGRFADNSVQTDRELIVISDFRRFGWTQRAMPGTGEVDTRAFAKLLAKLTGDKDKESKSRTVVTLVDVGEEVTRNISIESVALDGAQVPVTRARIGMTVKLLNRGDRLETNVEVKRLVGGKVAERIRTDLEPGNAKEILFEFKLEEVGPYNIEFVVEDSLAADSHYYMPLNLRDGIKVLMVNGETDGPDPEDREIYVLRSALFPRETSTLDVFEKQDVFLEPTVVDGLHKARDFNDYDLVIIANDAVDPSQDGRDQVERLEAYVANGGTVFFFLGDKVDADDFNSVFYRGGQGLSPVKLGEPVGDPKKDKIYWDLTPPESITHPALVVLEEADLFKGDTYTPSVRRRFPMTPQEARKGEEVTTLFYCREPGGSKQMDAVVMKEYTNGGVAVLFAFTADGAWTDFLTVRQKAIVALPFLHTLIHSINHRQAQIDPRRVVVGDPIGLTFDPRRPPKRPQMMMPNESEYGTVQLITRELPHGRKLHRFVLNDTRRAGRYKVRDEAGRQPPEIFAANVFLPESNLERVSPKMLKERFPGFVFQVRTDLAEIAAAQRELWKELLYIVLGLLILESILAALFSATSSRAG